VCAAAAGAHVVYGTKTLQGLTAEADLVLRARIAGPGVPASGRPSVEAEVLEVLKGEPPGPRVRFVQHGHGVAPFEPGAETLLFLLDVARSRELDALAEEAQWVSLQEHDEAYRLEVDTREVVLAAVRAYAAPPGEPAARLDALRAATLGLLRSGDPRLAASALRDLVLAPELPLLRAEDAAALAPVLDDRATSMGVRVGLLAELERRKLLDAPPRWLRLLSGEEPAGDRVTAIRAAGASRDARVRARLVELLADSDERVAAAAAAALDLDAAPAEASALAKALSHPAPSVRFAAIRSLGRSRGPDAAALLERAARSHRDPDTRRRAAAELRKP
jgi:HEAT repeat protein